MKKNILLCSLILVIPLTGRTQDTKETKANTLEIIVDELDKPVIPKNAGVRPPKRDKETVVDVYNDADLNGVLYGYAKQLRLTYVYSKQITEKVTARISSDDPWEAIHILARTYGYKIDSDYSSFRFYKPSWETEDIVETAVYKTKNLSPSVLKEAISGVLTKKGGVTSDVNSGNLIIKEIPSHLSRILQIVSEIDKADDMVFVEMKLIEVSVQPSKLSGVDWTGALGADGLTLTVGAANSLRSLINLDGSSGSTFTAPSAITFDVSEFNAVWRFLNTYTETKVLASPSILVKNHGQAALIKGVREQPIPRFGQQTATAGGNTTSEIAITGVEFKDIGTTLGIQNLSILEDGMVGFRTTATISSSSASTTFSGSTGNLNVVIPILQTRDLTSEVLVKNGDVILLGGIFDGTEQLIETKIPGLGDIPVLGALFKSKRRTKDNRKLMITIRPTIFNPKNSEQMAAMTEKARKGFSMTPADYQADPTNPNASTKPNPGEVIPKRGTTKETHPLGPIPNSIVGDEDPKSDSLKN